MVLETILLYNRRRLLLPRHPHHLLRHHHRHPHHHHHQAGACEAKGDRGRQDPERGVPDCLPADVGGHLRQGNGGDPQCCGESSEGEGSRGQGCTAGGARQAGGAQAEGDRRGKGCGRKQAQAACHCTRLMGIHVLP